MCQNNSDYSYVLLTPTEKIVDNMPTSPSCPDEDDDITVVHSNCSDGDSDDATAPTATLSDASWPSDRGCPPDPDTLPSNGPGKARRKHERRLDRSTARRAELAMLVDLANLER